MIGALSGKVINQNGEQLIVDVNGVGYEVTATNLILTSLNSENNKVSLVIYTDVKENSISLFGFKNNLEKEVFLLLKKVKGVGSRTAMSIVSAIGAEAILHSIGNNDFSHLKSVSGVGAKTAERIVVELRENVKDYLLDNKLLNNTKSLNSQISTSNYALPGQQNDVILALEKLGFSRDKAQEVLRVTIEKNPNISQDPSELLRLSLAN
ncbi:MAG: Holliday junction branch migration protein RuvA, partial [Proteobacteria bacterium]|nr:Holliday junction branch migration protein RuvA [Pseudomonadota bacterium]